MLRDSAIFGVLLAIMAVGFLQALSVKCTQTAETFYLIRNKSSQVRIGCSRWRDGRGRCHLQLACAGSAWVRTTLSTMCAPKSYSNSLCVDPPTLIPPRSDVSQDRYCLRPGIDLTIACQPSRTVGYRKWHRAGMGGCGWDAHYIAFQSIHQLSV